MSRYIRIIERDDPQQEMLIKIKENRKLHIVALGDYYHDKISSFIDGYVSALADTFQLEVVHTLDEEHFRVVWDREFCIYTLSMDSVVEVFTSVFGCHPADWKGIKYPEGIK